VPIAPGAPAPALPDHIALPAVLAFFKKSCPVCQMAFPVYGRLAQDANVVAVAQDHGADGWLAERGFTSTVIDDSDGYPLSSACGIRTVPTLVVVEGDGTVGVVAEGWDRDAVNDIAARLGGVGGGPVSTPADGLPPFKPG
jgi:thiol-disulfide isomerase/thioredoxin